MPPQLDITNRLESFLRGDRQQTGPIPLHAPEFSGNEWSYVKDCLDSGWVSSAGSYVTRFEEMCAAATASSHAIATVNGTTALHVALVGLGIGDGDLVLIPSLTFIATANAVSMTGAAPLFLDSDPITLGLSVSAMARFIDEDCKPSDIGLIHTKTSKRVAAVIPVHIFGHPTDMDELLALASKAGLPVVEDAAEALGSSYKGHPCGSLGQVGVLSFNGNKLVTSGGGGMVITNNTRLAERIRHLTTTARTGTGWTFDHDTVGYNYRLPNLNAALGCAQMENLSDFVWRKQKLASSYEKVFANMEGVTFYVARPGTTSNYWLNALLVDSLETRDRFLAETNAAQIQTRPCWRLISDTPAYQSALTGGTLEGARQIESRLINIPSSPSLISESPAKT